MPIYWGTKMDKESLLTPKEVNERISVNSRREVNCVTAAGRCRLCAASSSIMPFISLAGLGFSDGVEKGDARRRES